MTLPKDWTDERVCAWCGRPFTAHHTTQGYCSDGCRKTAKKVCNEKWRSENRERINREKRERYANDPQWREKIINWSKAWRQSEAGREYNKVYQKQYYQEHAEEARAYARQRREEVRNERAENNRHTCGFKGRCSDCPFDWCVEEDA